MRRSATAALVLVVAACGGSQPAPKTRLSTKELVEHSKPAIVRIESRMGTKIGVGTGFIVGSDGVIATNLHVILGSDQVQVTTLDGKKYQVKRIVAIDPKRDLALISITGKDLPTLRLGNSDEVSAGDRVVAIGNPLGVFDYTVSDGLISAVRPVDRNLTVLQISAPISQGSSGGPLFNPYGEVIGVATAIAAEGQNLNIGVPSNYVRALVAAPGPGEDMATFAARFKTETPPGSSAPMSKCNTPPVQRNIPDHPLSLLDGCTPDHVSQLFLAIQDAIHKGAPLYNDCEFEACFVIYRKVADTFRSDPTVCRGIRDAFDHGLARADGEKEFAAKAWAMRDTFDGLLEVIRHKVTGQP
jgi:hypothetical protein